MLETEFKKAKNDIIKAVRDRYDTPKGKLSDEALNLIEANIRHLVMESERIGGYTNPQISSLNIRSDAKGRIHIAADLCSGEPV